jgi:SNF2 family DNA or RNA helicase
VYYVCLLFVTVCVARRAAEQTLRGLTGEALVGSSGKLAVLDRLLLRLRAAGSRVLLFSQFTETLDVLQEYVTFRFGPIGTAFLRLDGSTNRIMRELDVRTFNAKDSRVFIYLISTKVGFLLRRWKLVFSARLTRGVWCRRAGRAST